MLRLRGRQTTPERRGPFDVWPWTRLRARVQSRQWERLCTDPAESESIWRDVFGSAPAAVRGRALDFGCGRGRFSAVLSNLGFEVTAIDVRSYETWRSLKSIRFVLGGEEALRKERDGWYDLFVAAQVLPYLKPRTSLLHEASRLLRRGGQLYLEATNERNLKTLVRRRPVVGEGVDVTYYRAEELARSVTEAGFALKRLWIDGVYWPIGSREYAFVSRVLAPGRIWRRVERLVPERYRGIIHIQAAKA